MQRYVTVEFIDSKPVVCFEGSKDHCYQEAFRRILSAGTDALAMSEARYIAWMKRLKEQGSSHAE